MDQQQQPGLMTQASQQTTANEHVQLLLRAASVAIAEFVGIKILKVLYTGSINYVASPEIL